MSQILDQAAQVDILDAAGRLIADPQRAVVSRAAMIAMALFSERAWEICIEADLLARAIQMAAGETRNHAIAVQAERVRTLMAALSGETQENEDGRSDS